MPIYEFRCLKCNHCQEVLVMGSDEQVEMKCASCGGEELERILSTTNYAMAAGASKAKGGASTQTRTCSSGSCTTWNLPGHTR